MRIFKLVCLVVTALSVPACLPMNGSFGDYYIAKRTPPAQQVPATETAQVAAPAPAANDGGVYINNYRLNAQEEVLMAAILKEQRIPPGRYYITQTGDMGLEGQAPYGNIIPYIREFQQRHAGGGGGGRNGGGTVINSNGGVGNGTFASNGKCAFASIPGLSIATPGC